MQRKTGQVRQIIPWDGPGIKLAGYQGLVHLIRYPAGMQR